MSASDTDSTDGSDHDVRTDGGYTQGQQPPSDGQPNQGLVDFALEFPRSRGWGPLVKGAVMLFFSFLILPAIILQGYAYRLGRAAATGEQQPAFDDYGGLLVDGLRYFLVNVLMVVVIVVSLLVLAQIHPLLGVVGYLLAVYVANAMLAVFIATGKIRNAFQPVLVSKLAFSLGYIKALVLLLAIGIALSIVAVISIITIVGPVFVYAYIAMVQGAFFGYFYRRSAANGTVPRLD